MNSIVLSSNVLPNKYLKQTDMKMSDFWDFTDIERTIQKATLTCY